LAALLSDDEDLQARQLEKGQFYIPYGGEWLRLWACLAEDRAMKPEGGTQ
jgi:hypothetical protein